MPDQKQKPLTREELLAIIEQAAREKKTVLDLSHKGIYELTDEIGKLTNLETLYLGNNRLTALPDTIDKLTNLQELSLSNNRLKVLPDSVCRLVKLRRLGVESNQLTTLIDDIGLLTNLEELWLDWNHLSTLPESLGSLTNLIILQLNRNQLTALPESIGHLINLEELGLARNRLKTLPAPLARLKKTLWAIDLEGNPLNSALKSAYSQGGDTLLAYLRSLEKGTVPLYEAKLVLVGEGGVGKTTLLKAMTGQEPREGEPTTHGARIDVKALLLPHPEGQGVEIQFNSWDFGGQEVYRVTHQFFFSRRSIYLLVWEPRKGVQACQVEDWLKIIRLRVGDDARVIIVSTHCKTGERIARIDKPVLMRDFGSMIVGFHEVDSLVDDPETGQKVGIAELKTMIADAAKNLEQMGMPFNRDWRAARDELLAMKEPCIAYAKFADVCARHGLDDIDTETLATLMHDLGYIVYYGDDERMKNDVVLQPEWLTKAIGFVLEDRKTQETDGILPDNRLREIWWDHPFKGETKYHPRLYPFFLRLMEKYDVSYRLEEGNASLVAQHVSQVRPKDLPWLADEEPTRGNRRIAMVCAMDDAPPGLVPWMIVRTHDYAYDSSGRRVHWQKGMFLWNKPHGEAMLELREREFHIYAEAKWPEYFMNVLRKTLQKLITDNWPGMEGRYYFAVPCKNRIEGKACDGRFRIDALRKFLEDGDEMIRCQSCLEKQDIVELLYGLEEMDLSGQMRAIQAKLDGLDSRIANYVWGVMQAIASESKEGPRLFTITPTDADWKKKPFAKRYSVHLWCEAEGCQHPVLEKGIGIYEFDAVRTWVTRIAPYANFIASVLKTALPIAGPAVNVFFGTKTTEKWGVDDELAVMKEATARLLPEIKSADPLRMHQGMLSEVERSGILALHALLRELDPNQEKLGLKRMPTYTGDYLWLCQKHYDAAQPKIPDKIG